MSKKKKAVEIIKTGPELRYLQYLATPSLADVLPDAGWMLACGNAFRAKKTQNESSIHAELHLVIGLWYSCLRKDCVV